MRTNIEIDDDLLSEAMTASGHSTRRATVEEGLQLWPVARNRRHHSQDGRLVIGTYCIERGHALLHNDHDFEPMREHLGLKIV